MSHAALRLAFMGSPAFAVPALQALHAAGHTITAAYTQPPRPAGRGHALRASAVQAAAEALGIPVRAPACLRGDAAAEAAFRALDLDAAVVVAYGQILPPAWLAAPRRGCLNIHASLLPRWRGAAPIQAAILAGDTESGVTVMQMDAGLDTGPMLLREAVPITDATTGATLHDALAAIGARLIVRALAETPPPVAQDDRLATYAPKLDRTQARIDWTAPAEVLARQVLAFDPWPGTVTRLDGAALKILAAEPADGRGPPGHALDDRLTIACGTGALRLLRVQAPGRAALPADAFLRGRPVPAGTPFG